MVDKILLNALPDTTETTKFSLQTRQGGNAGANANNNFQVINISGNWGIEI